jgi:uncharacterized protein with HEPN domain
VVRSLEIIGEATKNIPADFKVKHDTIKWKEMAGMRDRLIHDYMGVNYTIVWDVITNKIPDLLHQVNHVINTKEKQTRCRVVLQLPMTGTAERK